MCVCLKSERCLRRSKKCLNVDENINRIYQTAKLIPCLSIKFSTKNIILENQYEKGNVMYYIMLINLIEKKRNILFQERQAFPWY